MSKTVDAQELADAITEYLSYKIINEFDTRIRILDQAQKFSDSKTTEQIIDRAEKFAKFVFSKDAMACIGEEVHETVKHRGISLTNDDPASS